MKNNQNIIRCPQCDREYLPGEIYLPTQFLGQPKEVTKTSDGKIDLYEGIEQNTCERFKCEHCNTTYDAIDLNLKYLKSFIINILPLIKNK